MRTLFFCFLLIQISTTLIAQQANVLLTGTILNDSIGEVILEINKRYINNTVEEYNAYLNSTKNFGIACRVEIPQLVTLRYGEKSCQLFLEPNDSLHVEFNSQTFPEKIKFGQRAKDNNSLWQNYTKQFPKDLIIFNYRQYRKGMHYYKIHQDLDKLMYKTAPTDFVQLLETERKQKESMYLLFNEDPSKHLTDEFKTFIQTEFNYDHWLKLLTYGDVYQGRHRLDTSFLSFLDSALILNDLSLGNENYRDFITAFVHYRCRYQSNTKESIYIQLYNYSKYYLDGRTKYFTMAQFLATALRKENPVAILPIYEDFIKENPYYELDKIVLDPFQKANQFTAGTAAPNFALKNAQGETVQLSQLKGKVVYLDFWASWCRPCMQKIDALQALKARFKDKNVVFLHVSLDRSQENWIKTLDEKKFTGQQLFFDPMRSQITTDYEVLSVPKFFLITKKGNFAFTPSSLDSKELELALLKLLQN
ncbi:MAG: Peroxiredoxin [uncultured Aureispira sp.]|uniref:Peroxiredoxin n=1 Tax=uncultured Aureispira sp. TaxID=1331704 RepID=A0A6S6UK69_9BACT|nr:MAG: Peroxiredoxin [uncultured Aureispira sp.]